MESAETPEGQNIVAAPAHAQLPLGQGDEQLPDLAASGGPHSRDTSPTTEEYRAWQEAELEPEVASQ